MDLRRYKGVFYTANVGVKIPPPCVPESHLPSTDSLVDSAAIDSRLRAGAAPWPEGNALLMLRFDSTGALASMAVTSADLPDSTKRALALVVGTNVRERAPGVPISIQLRVASTPAGFAYTVASAVACAP